MISGQTPEKVERDTTGIGAPVRPWQQPLTPEKIEWLSHQFAVAKAKVEAIWGPAR